MDKKVKTFFATFKKSFLPNQHYYSQIPRAHWQFSLKYFVALVFFLNAVFWIAVLTKLGPQNVFSFQNAFLTSMSSFPDDLKVEFQNGKMKTNYDRPYFWWINNGGKKQLAVVVDEFGNFDKDTNQSSYLLFTDSYVSSNNISIPYTRSAIAKKNLVVDKNFVERWKVKLTPVLNMSPLVLLLVFFVCIPVLIGLVTLLYILILSLVAHPLYVFFFSHTCKFVKTFQIGLHAITLPMTLYFVLYFFGVTGNSTVALPLIFVNLIIVFIIGGLYEAYLAHHTRPKVTSARRKKLLAS